MDSNKGTLDSFTEEYLNFVESTNKVQTHNGVLLKKVTDLRVVLKRLPPLAEMNCNENHEGASSSKLVPKPLNDKLSKTQKATSFPPVQAATSQSLSVNLTKSTLKIFQNPKKQRQSKTKSLTTTINLPAQTTAAKSKTLVKLSTDITSKSVGNIISDDKDDVIDNILKEEAAKKEVQRRIYIQKNARKRDNTGKTMMQNQTIIKKEVASNTVIPKRKISNKTVQTKITCHDNICGIIDSTSFNISCFLCLNVFSLENWPLFISHMSRKHQLNEKSKKVADNLTRPFTRIRKPNFKVHRLKLPDEIKEKITVPTKKQQFKPNEKATDLMTRDLKNVLIHQNNDMPSTNSKSNMISSNSKMPLQHENLQETIFPSKIKIEYNLKPKPVYVDRNYHYSPASKMPQIETTVEKTSNKTISTSNSELAMPKLSISAASDSKYDLVSRIKTENSLPTDSDFTEDFGVSTMMDNILEKTSPTKSLSSTYSAQYLDSDIEMNKSELSSPSKTLYPYISTSIETMEECQKSFVAQYVDSEDEMPSNDENEDDVPNSTNGCGILFGITNRLIVLEFLKELEKYPELYKINNKTNDNINYNESIQKLHQHINATFDLDMSDFEIRLSIQRIKHWYCHMLAKMKKAAKQADPSKTFKHTFPEYFEILKRFLSNEANYTKDLVLGQQFQNNNVGEFKRYPKWMIYKKDLEPGFVNNAKHDEIVKQYVDEDLVFEEDEVVSDSEDDSLLSSQTSDAAPEPLICDICFVDFSCRKYLKCHRERHFAPKYSCATCRKQFYSNAKALKCTHKTERIRKKPDANECWSCEICGISYKTIGYLNYHMRDKHFDMRHKCVVCEYTTIKKQMLLNHQKIRHVVELGTCEEIHKKTRAKKSAKRSFTTEERKEHIWFREMKKQVNPGERFFGCYKCQMVFQTIKEKLRHNKSEHPIKENTVVCLLCKHEWTLFANVNSVRKHYTETHKIPWNEIDHLMKRTKPFWHKLTKEDIDLLEASENPHLIIAQILSERAISWGLETDDHLNELNLNNIQTLSYNNSAQNVRGFKLADRNADEFNDDDDLDQSTLYNEFVDYECEEHNTGDINQPLEHTEYPNENGDFYNMEPNYANDFAEINMGQAVDQLDSGDYTQMNFGHELHEQFVFNGAIGDDQLVEEVVSDDFDYIIDGKYSI